MRKALPLAEELGVKIAIEVVWNNFITKPEQLVEYVDEFKTPTSVGAYFDCSEHDQVRRAAGRLDPQARQADAEVRLQGLHGKNKWVPIGEGDEDWPEILKALGEIGYDGWATAEVGGGGPAELKRISQQMEEGEWPEARCDRLCS